MFMFIENITKKIKENTKAAVKRAKTERFYQIVINLSYLLNAHQHYSTHSLRLENLHILIHIKQ